MIHTVCKWNRLSRIILPRLSYGLGESFMQKRLGKLGNLLIFYKSILAKSWRSENPVHKWPSYISLRIWLENWLLRWISRKNKLVRFNQSAWWWIFIIWKGCCALCPRVWCSSRHKVIV